MIIINNDFCFYLVTTLIFYHIKSERLKQNYIILDTEAYQIFPATIDTWPFITAIHLFIQFYSLTIDMMWEYHIKLSSQAGAYKSTALFLIWH